MNLDFLKNVGINEEELNKKPARTTGGGHRKEWNPTHPLTIRVWKDGSIFPSLDLVERFDLEYVDRPAAEELAEGADALPADAPKKVAKWEQPGNAFDIIDTESFPVFKTPRRLILANVVRKADPRVDIFASGDWEAGTGKQKASVITQGANSFGKRELIPMIAEVFGVTLGDETPYIDLLFIGKDGEKAMQHFALPDGKKVCFVPKKVARGTDIGTPTTQRREDPWLYILMPLLEVHPELTPEKEVEGAKLSIADGADKK